jgi:hypothetical protein
MVPCLSVLFTKVLPLPAPAARDTCTFATTHRSGDNWFLPHSQHDASLTVELRSDVSLQVSGLNLNNAVFGLYNANSQAQFSGQREYYGRSVIMSVKYGFGVVPGTRARHIRGLAGASDRRTRKTFGSLSLAGREEFLGRLT